MPERTIDLTGRYIISVLTATEMVFTLPEQVNPNWLYVDLDGVGTTGYAQNVSIVTVPVEVPVDLNGTYTIATVTSDQIELVDPSGVSADWDLLSLLPGLQTSLTSAYLSKATGNWIGPFIVENPDTELLVANFVAQQGLFKDNGKKQKAFAITIEIEATPVDSNDDPVGAPETFSTTLPGNTKGRDQRAETLVCELATPGRQSVRARRTTLGDYDYDGTVVDEVKWQDLYGLAAVNMDDFGDVTTVHSRTYATEGALAVKDRKLNMLVTRKVPIRVSGSTFGPAAATKNAAEIFSAIAVDPYIGGRSADEVDFDAIYQTVDEVIQYFGSDEAGEYCFTLDEDNLSFEETATMLGNAIFCTVYRQGRQFRFEFERANEDSVLLFNHRNKDPGSETRTLRFGNQLDHDGIELEYVSPDDDTPATLYIPPDRSAVSPMKVDAYGCRSHVKAYWLAWRAWNRIRYQNLVVDFNALQEASLLVRTNRVLIADNTRPETVDGEVRAQDGLELELSQAHGILQSDGFDHVIFLQLPDGSVQAIDCVGGSDEFRVVLAEAPRLALSLDEDAAARCVFHIVRADNAGADAFLISEKEGDDAFMFRVQAVNYSPLYYANDQLLLWHDYRENYFDASPYHRDGTAIGASAIFDDPTRGECHSGTGASDRVDLPAFDAPASYTKAFWVKRGGATAPGSILSSTSTHERVRLHGSGTPPTQTRYLSAYHNGIEVLRVDWTAGVGWAHVAVTYQSEGSSAEVGDLAIYVDGELAGSAEEVAQRTLGPLHAVGYEGGNGLDGLLSDLRLISRALSPTEIRALYRSTRL